jgi:hypothetical protein
VHEREILSDGKERERQSCPACCDEGTVRWHLNEAGLISARTRERLGPEKRSKVDMLPPIPALSSSALSSQGPQLSDSQQSRNLVTLRSSAGISQDATVADDGVSAECKVALKAGWRSRSVRQRLFVL